jgi:molybdopterin-guanine dinucleotide biosynthesis protein A
MSRLGAIFAGGMARRFGADKAAATVDGIALLDRVAARMRAQCDALLVVGRDWPSLQRVDDLPRPGLGPLGALAGALAYARREGHAEVLTSGCDLPNLPPDLADLLAPGPSVIAGQQLLGLWPSSLADALLHHLQTSDDRSMRGWMRAAAAREVQVAASIANINTPEDLARFTTLPDE